MTTSASDRPGFTPGDPPLIDPTVLTTQQLIREMTSLRELFEARLGEIVAANVLRHEVILTRIDAMDKARTLTQAITDRLPNDIEEKISALREIMDEKFISVGTQFRERDVRTESTAKDSKVAVDAALQAAKEAVGEQNRSSALAINKSEMATTKQIDQMGLLIQTGNKAIDDKFSDLKDRLTRIEGTDQGVTKQVQGGQANNTILIAAAGLVIAMVLMGTTIYMALKPHP